MRENSDMTKRRRQVFIDTETTGLSPNQGHRIVELAAVEAIDGQLTGREFHSYLDPKRSIDPYAERVHGLSRNFLSGKPLFADVTDDFVLFIRGAELLMHNAPFDKSFIDMELALADIPQGLSDMGTVTCTVQLAKVRFPGSSVTLDALVERCNLGIKRDEHSALDDARLLAQVYLRLLCNGNHTGAATANNHCRFASRKPALSTEQTTPTKGSAMHTESDIATTTYLAWQFSS